MGIKKDTRIKKEQSKQIKKVTSSNSKIFKRRRKMRKRKRN